MSSVKKAAIEAIKAVDAGFDKVKKHENVEDEAVVYLNSARKNVKTFLESLKNWKEEEDKFLFPEFEEQEEYVEEQIELAKHKFLENCEAAITIADRNEDDEIGDMDFEAPYSLWLRDDPHGLQNFAGFPGYSLLEAYGKSGPPDVDVRDVVVVYEDGTEENDVPDGAVVAPVVVAPVVPPVVPPGIVVPPVPAPVPAPAAPNPPPVPPVVPVPAPAAAPNPPPVPPVVPAPAPPGIVVPPGYVAPAPPAPAAPNPPPAVPAAVPVAPNPPPTIPAADPDDLIPPPSFSIPSLKKPKPKSTAHALLSKSALSVSSSHASLPAPAQKGKPVPLARPPAPIATSTTYPIASPPPASAPSLPPSHPLASSFPSAPPASAPSLPPSHPLASSVPPSAPPASAPVIFANQTLLLAIRDKAIPITRTNSANARQKISDLSFNNPQIYSTKAIAKILKDRAYPLSARLTISLHYNLFLLERGWVTDYQDTSQGSVPNYINNYKNFYQNTTREFSNELGNKFRNRDKNGNILFPVKRSRYGDPDLYRNIQKTFGFLLDNLSFYQKSLKSQTNLDPKPWFLHTALQFATIFASILEFIKWVENGHGYPFAPNIEDAIGPIETFVEYSKIRGKKTLVVKPYGLGGKQRYFDFLESKGNSLVGQRTGSGAFNELSVHFHSDHLIHQTIDRASAFLAFPDPTKNLKDNLAPSILAQFDLIYNVNRSLGSHTDYLVGSEENNPKLVRNNFQIFVVSIMEVGGDDGTATAFKKKIYDNMIKSLNNAGQRAKNEIEGNSGQKSNFGNYQEINKLISSTKRKMGGNEEFSLSGGDQGTDDSWINAIHRAPVNPPPKKYDSDGYPSYSNWDKLAVAIFVIFVIVLMVGFWYWIIKPTLFPSTQTNNFSNQPNYYY
jgi:hypothetical protein